MDFQIQIIFFIVIIISRGASKQEEACDMYARAANMFKMAKNWSGKNNAFTVVSHYSAIYNICSF